MKTFAEQVYEVTRRIPRGKVATYGQIARLIENPGASRAVGNALHVNPDPDYTPCYRVVNGQGHLACHFGLGIEEQKSRLMADAIEVVDYKVDLRKYQWDK